MSTNLFATLAGVLLLGMPLLAEKKAIVPPEYAGGQAPYSPGILIDGTLYVSGQTGADLVTRQVPTDFEAEVKKCLDNIGLVLKAAGMSFQDAIAVNVYLTDMTLFPKMNTVYSAVFPAPRPARTTVEVSKLPAAGARIEITVTARK